MYCSLGSIALATGERVEAGVVHGPDREWAPRIESLLGHQAELWRWQNAELARRDVGVDAHFYLLLRGGEPFAHILNTEVAGAGFVSHVFVHPDERRKGAASRLMQLQMEHFRGRGGRALFLHTDFDGHAFHTYRRQGFVEVEGGSGAMEYYVGTREAFEADWFAAGATVIADLDWPHWPGSAVLFVGDHRAAVRSVGLGLFGRTITEGPLLWLLRDDVERRARGEGARVRVLTRRGSATVLGLAHWSEDPQWPQSCTVDVFCHPAWWGTGAALLDGLVLPEAERQLAYCDADDTEKRAVLDAAGFAQTGRLPKRVARDARRTRWADVELWERPG